MGATLSPHCLLNGRVDTANLALSALRCSTAVLWGLKGSLSNPAPHGETVSVCVVLVVLIRGTLMRTLLLSSREVCSGKGLLLNGIEMPMRKRQDNSTCSSCHHGRAPVYHMATLYPLSCCLGGKAGGGGGKVVKSFFLLVCCPIQSPYVFSRDRDSECFIFFFTFYCHCKAR